MASEVVPAAVLEDLRHIDDPELCDVFDEQGRLAETLRLLVRQAGLHRVAAVLVTPDREWSKLAAECSRLATEAAAPIKPDPAMLREAQRLFGRFAPEISGALLLAALPQSYATTFGAHVLAAAGGLENDLVRRVRGTAQFLLVVTQLATDDDDARRQWQPSEQSPVSGEVMPWHVCTALRLYHHTIRRKLIDDARSKGADAEADFGGKPLNQEDLLGILLTFSITVFEVLERYGICWTADEQEAYLHLWDVIGAYLGIGSPTVRQQLESSPVAGDLSVRGWHGLRPPSVSDTRALLAQIRRRQWADPPLTSAISMNVGPIGPRSLTSGRLLTSALLDELVAAMPPMLKLLPVTMMRTLAPDVVRRRLSLGHNGIVMRSLDQLPRRRNVIDRFTTVSTPNPLTGRALRALANEVSVRASVQFLRDPSFVIPGQEDWSRGFGRCC
jgi:ER-bound oxygenase mpaB/B'/Rubber oxygenase, catalytic domain